MRWLLRSVMCDLMPPSSTLPGLADTGIDTFLVRLQRETSGPTWLGLVLGAILYAVTPVATVGWPIPSFWLPASARALHAERAMSTRFYLLRQSLFLLKMYACMCWGQDTRVRQLLNVAPYPEDPGSFRQGVEQ